MTVSVLFRLILGIILIVVGFWGKSPRIVPGGLWTMTPRGTGIPIPRWAGAMLFVVFGLGFIYYALRPLIWH